MNTDIAETEAGLVRGSVESDNSTVFRGIPFAAAPVGELRFAPPAAVPPWKGVREAINAGASSLQNIDPLSMTMPGAERNYYSPRSATFSEDCLFLNVFTPAADNHARPVLVWIHGGGFVTGSGSGEWYDGTNIASKNDVVVVTINYRLGILGELYLGDLEPAATNLGLRDQIAALDWVRRNIDAFGGDPGNITIFGQSAGAMAVGALLVSPLAGGLFHRAIMQSGNVSNFADIDDAREVTRTVLDALKISADNVLEQLRDVSILRLLEVQRRHCPRLFPVRDGATIPVAPLAVIREGRAADVPLLIGSTADETRLFNLLGVPVPDPEFDLEDALGRFFDEGSHAIATHGAELYRETLALSDADLWSRATSDASFGLPSRRLADAHSSAGRPTYTFEMAIESTALHGLVGAAHEVDVPFVFDALDAKGVDEFLGSELVADPAARALARQTAAAWANFARTGQPALAPIPNWPRYDENNRVTVILDRVSTVARDHNRDRLDFWDAYGSRDPLGVLLRSMNDLS